MSTDLAVPYQSRVCGLPLVLFRDDSGSAVCLLDACSHRGYPLSHGRAVDGTIECQYHGLRFGASGRCVYTPRLGNVEGMDVRSFAVREQDGLVWVWLGDDAPATMPPALPWLHRDGWDVVGDEAVLEAPYLLLLENLVELSHESSLHTSTIGNHHVVETPATSRIDGTRLLVSRPMNGVAPPPLYTEVTGLTGEVDRSQDIEFFAPSLYLLSVDLSGVDGNVVNRQKIIYAVTPENDTRTRERWFVARDFGLACDAISQAMLNGVRRVVQEDVAAVEAQFANKLLGLTEERNMPIDAPALKLRRLLAAMGSPSAARAVDGGWVPDAAS